MKLHAIIAAAAIASAMTSCGTAKTVTETARDSAMTYIDTTAVTADTVTRVQTVIDTTRTVTAREDTAVIEFADSGGEVSIDKAGNVTMRGVKKMTARHKGRISRDNGITGATREMARHRERRTGIAARQTAHQQQAKEIVPGPRWYERLIGRLGLIVCIALLLYLINRYRKSEF